jgi:tetratricopeptide (TPR) repeat protein
MTEGVDILTPFKDHNEEKLRAITNLAQYHTIRGETDIAEQFIKEGKNIFNSSQSIAYKSFFIYAWSLVLTDQGKFKESEEVLNKAKEFPALYPAFEHGILHQKLETFTKQGKLTQAAKTFEEYEKKLNEFFKRRQNIGLGNAFFFKGVLLIENKKKITEALTNLTMALKIYQEAFHGDKRHRNQGRAHLAMGKAYKINTEFKNALKEYLLSEEIYDIVLKKKTIDDISDLYTELAILGVHLKDEGLTQKYLTVHIDTFGLDHPRTEKILKHLDRVSFVGAE